MHLPLVLLGGLSGAGENCRCLLTPIYPPPLRRNVALIERPAL